MRSIHWVRLDKVRPAVLLTREMAVPFLRGITVAPITRTIAGIATEMRVGPQHGLDHECVVNCDTITTVAAEHVGDFIGFLSDDEERRLLLPAILAAFDLTILSRQR